MQPRTTTRSGAIHVDDRAGRTRAGADLDHPQQDGPEASFPAPHACTHRAHAGTHGVVSAVRHMIGEPDPWPSLSKSSAPAHES